MIKLATARRPRRALMVLSLSAVVGVCLTANGQSPITESSFRAIRLMIDSGRYAEAESEAANQFSTAEQAYGHLSPDSVPTLDLFVEALVRNGKGAELRTRTLAEQAIRMKEARFGAGHSILASSVRNLGDVLIQAGEYRDATAAYKRALALRKLTVGADSQDAVDDLDRLVRSLTLVEQYDEALRVSNEALRLRETDRRETGVRTARTLEVRGLLLQRRGDFSSARPALERALALRESAYGDHPEIAEILSLLGEQYRFEGDLVRAKEFGERTLAVAKRTLRPDHPDIASYLRSLANPVSDLGDTAAGRALREAALTIGERALGPDHVLVGVQLNDLAASFFTEGDYLRARKLWERALDIFERHLGPEHSRVTTAVYNLAYVSGELGDFAEARRQFTRAISTWERVVGPNHVFVARAVSALAEIVSKQGRYAEAHDLWGRALTIRERALGANHLEVATILTNMAANAAKLDQVQLAYELSSRALRIHKQSSTPSTQRTAEVLTTHGTIQAIQRDYSGAQESYEHALRLLRPIVGPSHPQVAEVLIPLGTTLANLRRSSDSLQTGLDAEEIGRAHLRLMLRHLPERQGLEYARKRPKGLDLALSLAAAARDPLTTPILDQLIRSRGLVLDEIAERRHLSASAGGADLAPLWRTLVSARQRFANLVIRGSAGLRGDQYSALVDAARREKEETERALAEKSALFRDGLVRTEIGLDEIRASLPPKSAVVAFARYSRTSFERLEADTTRSSKPITPRAISQPTPSYIAFVLVADSTQPAAVALGAASDIDRLVARWREQATGILYAPSREEADRRYRGAGAALRQRVWDPLRTHLNDVDAVFIVPDGALNLVSFATLPAGETGFLIERGPVIHYLSAERDLVSSETPKTNPGGLLALGGPAFDDGTLFARGPSTASTPGVAPSTSESTIADTLRAGCGTLQAMQFGSLAGTGREAREVAALWTDSQADVLEGRAANEQTFKRNAPGHRVLHLATHGFFLGNDCIPMSSGTRSVGGLAVVNKNQPTQPKPSTAALSALTDNPLLMSGLALAGANRRATAATDDEDGILTAEEVSAMNLDGVEWAVLSACDTGLGEVTAGEGVFGLRRAFQIAGVRTVIMSLWSVDDEATRLWMRALYLNRLQKHLNTAQAMRAASLTVLGERRAKGQSTHPFYWGAFVAAGSWR